MDIATLGLAVRPQEVDRASQSLDRFSGSAKKAETSARGMGTGATEAARKTVAANDNAVKSTRRLGGAFDAVKRQAIAFGAAIAVALGGRAILNAADEYTQFTNALRVAGVAGSEMEAVQDRLFAAANRNGVEIGALSRLYSRASIAADELGASQEELLQFVDGVTAALRLQGGSAASSSGALMQLSQSLSSGIVRAEEFNSILEGAFPIAQAAARGIDGMGGSVAKLRTAIINGEITSQEFFDGLLKGFTATEAIAAGMSLTVGQALTVLGNSFMRLIGTIDSAFGVSGALASGIAAVGQALDFLAQGIDVVAAHMDTIAVAAGTAGTMLAFYFGPTVFAAIIANFALLGRAGVAAITAITAAMARNPLGALAVGITIAITALYHFRDNVQQAVGVDVIGIIGNAVDKIINSFRAAFADVVFIWKNLPDAMQVAVFGAVNMVIRGVNDMVSTAAAGIDRLIGMVNNIPGVDISPIGGVKPFDEIDTSEAQARLVRNNAAHQAEIDRIMASSPLGALGGMFETSTPKIEDFSGAIAAANDNLTELGGAGSAGGGAAKAAKDGIDSVAQAAKDAAEEAARAAQAVVDFAKDITKSFISDLRSGLEQGKGFWKSFRDAALNALDSIATKLINLGIDGLFSGLSGGGGAGIFGGIAKLFGFQHGAAFNHGNVVPFARGGVVDRPTLFPMASGAGLMGEAGPEAVMPLRRGPSGRLGVEMHMPQSREADKAGERQEAPVRIINAIDGPSFLSEALATPAGERVILNHVRANSGAFKQALG